MGKLYKNKKVIAATVTLALVILGASLGTEFGADTANIVTELICNIVSCQ